MDARDNQSKTQLLTRRNTECNDFKYKGDKTILSIMMSIQQWLHYVMLCYVIRQKINDSWTTEHQDISTRDATLINASNQKEYF